MTELEKLEAERDKISMQIKILELENKPVFDYSNYENNYYQYDDGDTNYVFIKKWLGNKYDLDSSNFALIIVHDRGIYFLENKYIYFEELTEITKEEYENEFNKILTLLK